MKLTVLYVLMFLHAGLMAQKHRSWTIKPGESPQDVIPHKELFKYESFLPGMVFFNDGKTAPGKLNLNMLIGEIQFVDTNGDTMSLANENTIRLVVIGKDSFIVNSGCWQYTKGQGKYNVVEKFSFREYVQKGGAYGMSSATAATESLSSFIDQRAYSLVTERERVIVKSGEYGIVNQAWQLIYPDRKKLSKTLTKHKAKLNDYLSSNPVTANKPGDFEKLADFLNTLGN